MAENAKRDENHVTSILFVGSDGLTYQAKGDEVTGRLYVDMAGGGMTNPMTTGGDIIYGGASGTPTRLANGTAGQILTSNGTTLAPTWENATGGGASTALSNLASVAINTSLVSDTDSTDSLGSTGIRWLKLWVDDIESTNMPTVGGTSLSTTFAATAQTFYIGTTQVAINRASAALTLAGLTLTTPDIGTPSAGVLTNCTGLPIAGLTASTSTALGVGSIELGHASDTTISRVSAGVVAIEGVTIPTISSTNDISNKNFTTGNSISGEISIDGTPNTDATATGNVTSTFAAGYSSAVGDLVFFGSGGKWLEVDSDAVATCQGLMGIALEAKTDTQAMKVALPGSFVRLDAWNWTVGATLYAGETLGAMQETIPTGADAIIKVVGFAVTADVIFFNPSPDQQSTVA